MFLGCNSIGEAIEPFLDNHTGQGEPSGMRIEDGSVSLCCMVDMLCYIMRVIVPDSRRAVRVEELEEGRGDSMRQRSTYSRQHRVCRICLEKGKEGLKQELAVSDVRLSRTYVIRVETDTNGTSDEDHADTKSAKGFKFAVPPGKAVGGLSPRYPPCR